MFFQEVCVIRYEASSDDEKLSYVSLYSYFYSRKRCGVVSNCYTGVKDMYLVPLASHQSIPPELLPFDGPGKNVIFGLKLRLLQAFMKRHVSLFSSRIIKTIVACLLKFFFLALLKNYVLPVGTTKITQTF